MKKSIFIAMLAALMSQNIFAQQNPQGVKKQKQDKQERVNKEGRQRWSAEKMVQMQTARLTNELMLDDANAETRGRDHHCSPGRSGTYRLITMGIPEATLFQQFICFIKVVHIHTNPHQIPWQLTLRLQDIEMESIRVLHPDNRIIPLCYLDPNLRMGPFKAQLFKQTNRLISV